MRSGFNINSWLSPELGAAFERLRKKTRMTKRMQLEDILEKALADAGEWSPGK
jgi:hypothetical protein